MDAPAKAARRAIFSYQFDGKTYRVDPLAVDRRFKEAIGAEANVLGLFKKAFAGPPEGFEVKPEMSDLLFWDTIDPARKTLVDATLKAFRHPALDDDPAGMSEEEAIGLLLDFGDWKDEVKKSTDPGPNSTPSTAPPTGAA